MIRATTGVSTRPVNGGIVTVTVAVPPDLSMLSDPPVMWSLSIACERPVGLLEPDTYR